MNTTAFQPSIKSQISHEIRIPLSGIFGCADFLSKTSLSSEQKEYLEIILASANRLLALEEKIFLLIPSQI